MLYKKSTNSKKEKVFLRPKARAKKAISVLGADLRHQPDAYHSEAPLDASEIRKRSRSRDFAKKHKKGNRQVVSELATQLSHRVSHPKKIQKCKKIQKIDKKCFRVLIQIQFFSNSTQPPCTEFLYCWRISSEA